MRAGGQEKNEGNTKREEAVERRITKVKTKEERYEVKNKTGRNKGKGKGGKNKDVKGRNR